MSRETSQTLDRGLTLLTLLADNPEGMRVSDLAAELGIGRTVVYRLVVTLERHALLRRAADGRWYMGLGLIGLARQVQPLLREAALPPLRRLADATGATAHLTITDGSDGLVVVAVAEPLGAELFVGLRVGSRSALDDSAAGRAVLRSRRGDNRPVVCRTNGAGSVGSAAAVLNVPGIEAVVGVFSVQTPDDAALAELVAARDSIAVRLR
jgi:DNA-binding IclR family transcriptional regulator